MQVNESRFVDRIFKDYYNGGLKIKIDIREEELATPGTNDQNTGGGKLENVNSAQESQENALIRKEQDHELRRLRLAERTVKTFLAHLPEDSQKLLFWTYREASRRSMDDIAADLNKSRRQCYRDLAALKQRFLDMAGKLKNVSYKIDL